MTASPIVRTAFAFAVMICVVGGVDHPVLATQPAARAAEKTKRVETPEKPRQKPRGDERTPFTAADVATARPEGLAGRLRFFGDDREAFQALIDEASAAGDPWLVLSGGGENGAFAAGILNGWSAAGDRPAFGVVTGASTGALIAPFAFVGSGTDDALKRNYTDVTAADVFELGGTNAALADNWPLKDRIAQFVTPELLHAVASEHAKGRRLLIVTTLVDAERPVVWDMGAIASLAAGPEGKRDGERALKLFREILFASSAVPAVFPPVMIEAVGRDGKRFQEMHDDGAAMAPFYLAPAATLSGDDSAPLRLPMRTVYLVVNNRLDPEFGLTPRTVLGVLGNTMSGAIKEQTRMALSLARSYAACSGFDLKTALIDKRFTMDSPGPFDPDYMKALFDHGEALARAGNAFPADQAQRPKDAGTCLARKDDAARIGTP